VTNEFIGQGWAFPIRTSPTGGIALVSGSTEIEEAMHIVLSTSPGERPMRPDFGCRLNDFVFSPADSTTAGLMAHEVRSALERWEPRVNVMGVDVRVDPMERNVMYLHISYQVKGSYDRRSLVFPFYTIPEEPRV
jgi:phage baseplate assembly protein W